MQGETTMASIFDPVRQWLSAARPVGALSLFVLAGAAFAQQPAPQPRDYYTGNPGVGLPIAPGAPAAGAGPAPAAFAPASRNVRMFGALYSVESCVYDRSR